MTSSIFLQLTIDLTQENADRNEGNGKWMKHHWNESRKHIDHTPPPKKTEKNTFNLKTVVKLRILYLFRVTDLL